MYLARRIWMTRSIPACAGEPTAIYARTVVSKVYPRVCGGTVQRLDRKARKAGLSPRVRGNRGQARQSEGVARSIPACAGEPPAPAYPPPVSRVYPRVCGGTGCRFRKYLPYQGLSPRVRGNLSKSPATCRVPRSIPACAGEPAPATPANLVGGVYPRVCGGTPPPECPSCGRIGLSPRVRGNPRSCR